MIKVLFVCHGNICRSTMAESIFTHLIKERGLEKEFEVFSAGTSREELGNPVHYGTVKKLKEVGIPVIPHKATQITKKDFDYYDYILVMDDANIRNIELISGTKNEKVKKLLFFTNSNKDIADPWYTGNFDKTYDDTKKGLIAFLNYLDK